MYQQPGTPPRAIRVIARRPEQLFELGERAMHSELPEFECRVSEVATPSRGDEMSLDGRLYRVEAEPQLDLHHLVWQLPCRAVSR